MLQIIVGTETGTAEFVADELAELLSQHNIDSNVTLEPNAEILEQASKVIICTSTQGAGELPNNLKALQSQLDNKDQLSKLNFFVIALGDSSYDTFCQAGITIHNKLIELQATPILPLFKIDAMEDQLPEDILINYLSPLVTKFA